MEDKINITLVINQIVTYKKLCGFSLNIEIKYL